MCVCVESVSWFWFGYSIRLTIPVSTKGEGKRLLYMYSMYRISRRCSYVQCRKSFLVYRRLLKIPPCAFKGYFLYNIFMNESAQYGVLYRLRVVLLNCNCNPVSTFCCYYYCKFFRLFVRSTVSVVLYYLRDGCTVISVVMFSVFLILHLYVHNSIVIRLHYSFL